jgi:hypothetical protein
MKASCSKAKVIQKSTPPKELAYMKAPPKTSVSHPSTRWAVRRSVQVPKAKNPVGWLLVYWMVELKLSSVSLWHRFLASYLVYFVG